MAQRGRGEDPRPPQALTGGRPAIVVHTFLRLGQKTGAHGIGNIQGGLHEPQAAAHIKPPHTALRARLTKALQARQQGRTALRQAGDVRGDVMVRVQRLHQQAACLEHRSHGSFPVRCKNTVGRTLCPAALS